MNLIEGIQSQQARVRGLLREYESFGMFGTIALKQTLEHGDKSIADGDVVDMLAAYKDLEACE